MTATENTAKVQLLIATGNDRGIYPTFGIDVMTPATETGEADWIEWIELGEYGEDFDFDASMKTAREAAFNAGWRITDDLRNLEDVGGYVIANAEAC